MAIVRARSSRGQNGLQRLQIRPDARARSFASEFQRRRMRPSLLAACPVGPGADGTDERPCVDAFVSGVSGEGRTLGAARDHTDIDRVWTPERFDREQEVERMIVRKAAPGGAAQISASGRADRVVGVPGPAKSSSVWRWSMSLGERCRNRRACASARPTWPAPAPPTSRRSRRALAPRASAISPWRPTRRSGGRRMGRTRIVLDSTACSRRD